MPNAASGLVIAARPGRVAGLIALLVLAISAGSAAAQRSGVNVPGDFAYYVLALSWSPSYCAAEGTAADRLQCDSGRPYDFVVHGLWPQYERGWPEFCPAEPSEAPPQLVRDMLDLIPSEGLIRHQWRKHGTCSGLTPRGYFETTRRARSGIAVPPAFQAPDEWRVVSPDDVRRAFLRANPGLPADGIAVTCDRQRLREVRVCLDRHGLDFRSCPPVAQRACGRSSVRVPPVR